jgi:transcription elongation factor GreA-like protein/transcription elongation GreA/GreB family factor
LSKLVIEINSNRRYSIPNRTQGNEEMGYLEDFQVQIYNRDFSKFWQLWEEYCTNDTVDSDEFIQILKIIKSSEFAKTFGQYVETALPFWECIKEKKPSYNVLKLLVDLQTTNSPKLADVATQALTERYSSHPLFNDRMRMIGLRTRENFQGALSNYDLLAHMEKGKFVYHTGGWGVGEIVDMSIVREQLSVEFEFLSGHKHFTFSNAFKALIPLEDEHFFARRFANPDRLEQEARANPVEIIKLLLRDLGPKSAAEIKDELCDLVIPEKDWTKWWQTTRSKIKKDTMIDTPEALKESFKLHKAEVTHEQRFQTAIAKETSLDELLQSTYSFVRDNPTMLKKKELKDSIQEKLIEALSSQNISKAQELQIQIFLENQFGHQLEGKALEKVIKELDNIESLLENVEIIAFRKRILTLIRQYRSDWTKIFLGLIFTNQQSTLRDYILKELSQGESQKLIKDKLLHLANNPLEAPEFLVWYFQKITSKGAEELLYSDKEGQCLFFEALLILFSSLDARTEYKDLSKKIYTILSAKRYLVVRQIIEGTSLEFIKEFLLLVSKCQGLNDHDIKILRSLAEVVHPSLCASKSSKGTANYDGNTLWTTEAGYQRTKDRVQQISHVEIVENAREIEAARALGDLRENSEYKFALEKRSRLNSELRHLSQELNHARIITPDLISKEEVGLGSKATIQDSKGNVSTYTILGPWDADIDKGILSSQSKFSLAMVGKKKGEKFQFRDDEFTIIELLSYLE